MLTRRTRTPVVQLDRSDEALRSIGQELREARTARGEDLFDIAAFLRIRPAYLSALEQGDISAIPGRPYAIGFLRGYGDYLGLDGKALVARLKSAVHSVTAPPELNYREPLSESRRPTVALVTASLMLATALYAGYYVLSADRNAAPERVAQAPGEFSELARNVLASRDPGLNQSPVVVVPPAPAVTGTASAPAPAEPTPAQTVSAPVVPAEAPAPAAAPAPAQTAAAPAAPPAPADVTSAVAAETSSAEGAAGPTLLAALDSDRMPPASASAGAATEGRLVIVARDSSWVQIRSPGRDYVRTRTMQPGERFVVPDRTDLALWTGNAGGLEILVDGRSLGQLGETGAVLKNLPLAPDSLKQRITPTAR